MNRGEFRAQLRGILANTTVWSDAALNGWIDEGLADLSIPFPRVYSARISCTAGVQLYAFGAYPAFAGLQSILEVEYPYEQTPRRLLLPGRESSSTFDGSPAYDLRGEPPTHVVLGESPQDGEEICLTFNADHPAPADDLAELTLPESCLEPLQQFVVWKATQALEMDEAADPDTTSLLLSMLGGNAGRAERIYTNMVRAIQSGQAPGEYGGPWAMDESDRVY